MPEIEWAILKDFTQKGLVWKGVVSKQTIAVGNYLHAVLLNPSISTTLARTITFLSAKASTDRQIWSSLRLGASISNAMTGVSAVNAKPDCSINTRATISYINANPSLTGGSIFAGDFVAPRYMINFSNRDYGPAHITQDLVVLNKGSWLTISYGPAEGTAATTITLELTWIESNSRN